MMPTLTKPDLVAALREKVAEMTGTDAEIAEALNAPEVTGHETRDLTPIEAYEAISAATLLALDEAAGSDAGAAGEALWWLSALADVEPMSLSEGSRARATLDALAEAKLIPEAERAALLEAATVPVSGPSWAQQAGIGRVYSEFVSEVRN